MSYEATRLVSWKLQSRDEWLHSSAVEHFVAKCNAKRRAIDMNVTLLVDAFVDLHDGTLTKKPLFLEFQRGVTVLSAKRIGGDQAERARLMDLMAEFETDERSSANFSYLGSSSSEKQLGEFSSTSTSSLMISRETRFTHYALVVVDTETIKTAGITMAVKVKAAPMRTRKADENTKSGVFQACWFLICCNRIWGCVLGCLLVRDRLMRLVVSDDGSTIQIELQRGIATPRERLSASKLQDKGLLRFESIPSMLPLPRDEQSMDDSGDRVAISRFFEVLQLAVHFGLKRIRDLHDRPEGESGSGGRDQGISTRNRLEGKAGGERSQGAAGPKGKRRAFQRGLASLGGPSEGPIVDPVQTWLERQGQDSVPVHSATELPPPDFENTPDTEDNLAADSAAASDSGDELLGDDVQDARSAAMALEGLVELGIKIEVLSAVEMDGVVEGMRMREGLGC